MTIAIDYRYYPQASQLGLSIAVEGVTRAFLSHTQSPRLICHSADPESQKHFLTLAKTCGIETETRCFILDPAEAPDSLRQLDCLFIPDPDLSKASWLRAQAGSRHALCGLVHSMSGEQVAKVAWEMCLAPLMKSDALICPSRAIRDSVVRLWEIQCDYLSHRFGKRVACEIQTPVIPLGIDTAAFAGKRTPDKRKRQRDGLGCTDDEVVILFIGRLNFATKAHPLPLLLAAQAAAQKTKKRVRLVLYGYFLPAAEMGSRFRALLKDYETETLTCELVESSDPRFPDGLLAAADLFVSLVDNIQESFGLTPIEAMAGGLPVVATDWDGYRDGIRDGTEGFLIPTYMPPQDPGADVAFRYCHEQNYGAYLMGAAQSTAIDIPAAAKALLTLIEDDSLRQTMGEAGQKRARETYDWKVIIPAYEEVWQKLGSQARQETPNPLLPDDWRAVTPAFPNPFALFETFPTQIIAPSMSVTLTAKEADIVRLFRHDMNYFVPSLLLPRPLLLTLIETIGAHGTLSVQTLMDVTPSGEQNRLLRSIGWLVKHGICRLEHA